MKLVEPSLIYKQAYLEAIREFEAAGELHIMRVKEALEPEFSYEAYVEQCKNESKGIGLPDGWVPATTFLLVENDHVLAISSLRHRLTPNLEREGGHIGYEVPPSKRLNGYATQALRLTL